MLVTNVNINRVSGFANIVSGIRLVAILKLPIALRSKRVRTVCAFDLITAKKVPFLVCKGQLSHISVINILHTEGSSYRRSFYTFKAIFMPNAFFILIKIRGFHFAQHIRGIVGAGNSYGDGAFLIRGICDNKLSR